jgi:hypothetical protein
MIRVEVQDYCQSCLEFEPDVERPTQFYADSKVVKQTDTVIRTDLIQSLVLTEKQMIFKKGG